MKKEMVRKLCGLLALMLHFLSGITVLAEMENELTKEVTHCPSAPVELLEELCSAMDVKKEVETQKYLQLRYKTEKTPESGFLGCFDLYDPSITEEEVQILLMDLRSSARWTIYDGYRYLLDSIEKLPGSPINLEKLQNCFNEEWQEVESFSFAGGWSQDKSGDSYYWVPVYYESEDGSIFEDTIYLFVCILRNGADEELLEKEAYYAVYGEYNMDRLVIADQKLVRDFLEKAFPKGWETGSAGNAENYETLTMESNGDAVRNLQKALLEQGYLESSVDGYYGEFTAAAVSAYQKAQGMEVTGTADEELQVRLLSYTREVELLNQWMNGRKEEE